MGVAMDEAKIRQMELDGSLFQLAKSDPLQISMATNEQVVAVCDPVSTGGAIAAELSMRGYLLIKVWTAAVTDEFKAHVPSVAKEMPWLGEVSEQRTVSETCAEILSLVGERELAGIVVGAETDV